MKRRKATCAFKDRKIGSKPSFPFLLLTFSLVLAGTLFAGPLLAQTPSVHWWKSGVYAADAAVWWTLDDDVTSTELRDSWQSLDAHQERYQSFLVAEMEQFQWGGDAAVFFVDGDQTPDLIPMWMAWEKYERLASAASFSTNGTIVEAAKLDAAGLSAAGRDHVLAVLDLYAAERDQLAQQLDTSYQSLKQLLQAAEQAMGAHFFEKALDQEDYASIAAAASVPLAELEGHVADTRRYAPVEAAAGTLSAELRPHLSDADWRALRRMLLGRAAAGIRYFRPAPSSGRAPGGGSGPTEALIAYNFTDDDADGYFINPLDPSRTQVSVIGEAEYVGPMPIDPDDDLYLTTSCFMNYEQVFRTPPLQMANPDGETADVKEITTQGAGTIIRPGIRRVTCHGAGEILDNCADVGLLNGRNYWGFQRAVLSLGLSNLEPVVYDAGREERELDCQNLVDVSGSVENLGANLILWLDLSVRIDGVVQPELTRRKLFTGSQDFLLNDVAPVGSTLTIAVGETSDGVFCSVDGSPSKSYSVPPSGVRGVQVDCSGGPNDDGEVPVTLSARFHEWAYAPLSGTATTTLQTPDGAQSLTVSSDATEQFPSLVRVGASYIADVTSDEELNCSIAENASGIVDGPFTIDLDCYSLPLEGCDVRPDVCQDDNPGTGCRPQIYYDVSTVTVCSEYFGLHDPNSGGNGPPIEIECEPQTTKTLHIYLDCTGALQAPNDLTAPLAYLRSGDVRPHSGIMVVRGVARDEQSGIGELTFFLDGQLVLLDNLETGLYDEETCDDFPTAGCNPYSGFRGELDTTQFADGVHRLTVSVDRGDGGIGTLAESEVIFDNTGAMSDGADVVSHTLPESLLCAGERWASVTMRNTGSSTWTRATHALGAQDDSDPFQTSNRRYELPEGVEVPPGESHTFWIPFTSPSLPGVYHSDWRMLRLGVDWFGAVAARDVVVDCTADVRLELSYLPGAGQPRATAVIDDETPGSVDYYYNQARGNFEERPGGTCWAGHDNNSYVNLRVVTNLELDGCEYQLSTDAAPKVCGQAQLESFQSGAWIPLNTDDALIDPTTCRPFQPLRPHMGFDEDHWLRITVFSDGTSITRQVDLRQANVTPPLPPYLRLLGSYAPSAGAPRTTFESGVAAPPAFHYHYDASQGHFEQRPQGACPDGDNPTYLRFSLEGEPIDGCLFETSMDPGWRACPSSMVTDLNAGQWTVIGTDDYRIDPATCEAAQPLEPWVLPAVTHSVGLRLQAGGQEIERRLTFVKD